MDEPLVLSMACLPNDRTLPFFSREVGIDRVRIDPIAMDEPTEIFRAMLRDRAFAIAEMSLGQCFEQAESSTPSFVALPVFLSRSFRHGYIFVNRNSGITEPRQLAGRRIGVQHHGMSAAVWIRIALRTEFGVDFSTVRWVEGAVNRLGSGVNVAGPSRGTNLNIETVQDKTLSDMLATGEIDAMIGAWVPDSFTASAEVARLFPDSRAAERRYFTTSGVFPIMHALVLRSDLHREHPWLADRVFGAFVRAKALMQARHRSSGALSTMLPWLRENLAEVDEVFGGADCWPYGLEANRKTLMAFAQGLKADGAIRRPLALDQIFLPFS